MSVNVEKNENNELLIDIQIDAKEVSMTYENACRNLSQRVNVPGFRKGKVPKKILEKHVGVEYIQREVLDRLMPKVLSEVINGNNYDTVTEPSLDYFRFEEDGSLTAKARVELRPEFELQEYKGIEVEIEGFKQPENALEKELNDIREKQASLETVEGRATNDKDLVNIDFEGFVDGEAIKGGAAKGYLLDLGHSNFIPGFAEQLVGKEKGSEFTIQVKFPDEYHDDKIKGKDAEFKIKINEIKERILPELTDEVAKKVGKFETVDELKADIQKYLDASEKSENDKRAMSAIFEKLLNETDIKIQDSMINREVSAITSEMGERAVLQGQDIKELMKEQGGEEFDKEMREEAVKRIKTALIVSKIARNENIKLEGSDLDSKVYEMSRLYGIQEDKVVQEIQKNPNLFYALNQQIMGQKVSKFLLDNAKVTKK